jgi:alpha-1,3-rhamnosyl/mannosyltransferase
MLRLIDDEQESQRRAELGRAQAARFTWQACAAKTLEVYRKVLADAGARVDRK